MGDIVDSVKRVTDIMGEIMGASQEQSAGIDQINQAIGQMDQVTQQNAALVEQAAAASGAMQEQAAKLAQVVSAFRLHATASAVADAGYRAPATPRATLPAPARRPVKTSQVKDENVWEEF